MNKIPVRCVTHNDKKYILAEDVSKLIRELAFTEESDVRTRLNKLAENILVKG